MASLRFRADFVAEVGRALHEAALIFLEAWPPADPIVTISSGGTAVGGRARRLRHLRNARGGPIRRMERQFGDAAQVLGDGCERKLELCASGAAQSQAA
jgi:hypothetical protein